MSEQQAKDIIFVYNKIRNTENAIDAVKFTGEYKNNMSDTKVKEIVNPEIELNISVNSMIDNSIDVGFFLVIKSFSSILRFNSSILR